MGRGALIPRSDTSNPRNHTATYDVASLVRRYLLWIYHRNHIKITSHIPEWHVSSAISITSETDTQHCSQALTDMARAHYLQRSNRIHALLNLRVTPNEKECELKRGGWTRSWDPQDPQGPQHPPDPLLANNAGFGLGIGQKQFALGFGHYSIRMDLSFITFALGRGTKLEFFYLLLLIYSGIRDVYHDVSVTKMIAQTCNCNKRQLFIEKVSKFHVVPSAPVQFRTLGNIKNAIRTQRNFLPFVAPAINTI